jgi:heme A synthase
MDAATQPLTPKPDARVVFVRRLALGLSLSTFALMIVGATVRVMGAGLSCPDWPLCHGQAFPPYDPVLPTDRIYTQIEMLAEMLHRFFASLVSVGVLVLALGAVLSRNRSLIKYTALAGVVLALQIVLGAVTIFLANVHLSVAAHLGAAIVFLLLLTWIYRVAAGYAPQLDAPAWLRPVNAAVLVLLGTQILLGAVIAKVPGADMVCPSFPRCGIDGIEGVEGLYALQTTHRVLAFLILGILAGTLIRLRARAEHRPWVLVVLALTVLQVGIGIANVLFHIPPALSVSHMAAATLIFLSLFHWTASIGGRG